MFLFQARVNVWDDPLEGPFASISMLHIILFENDPIHDATQEKFAHDKNSQIGNQCIGQGDLYIDKNMYLTSQPERFKGFLSSDFSKTDEFSNVCRTEQYRSQLKASAQYHSLSDKNLLYVYENIDFKNIMRFL